MDQRICSRCPRVRSYRLLGLLMTRTLFPATPFLALGGLPILRHRTEFTSAPRRVLDGGALHGLVRTAAQELWRRSGTRRTSFRSCTDTARSQRRTTEVPLTLSPLFLAPPPL